MKHAAGLGHQPNVVPVAQPVLDGSPRPVEIGWHPVGGGAGKWLAEETGLGKMITEKINEYPDPTQHWAVLVGDYAHQLWMDEEFHVIYTNQKVERDEWRTFEVGKTTFNDDAVRRAGEAVIQTIRGRQPVYNLITNNCQTYVLQLLDAIKVGVYKELGTTRAVYEKLTGRGKVAELFEQEEGADGGEEDANTVSFAQKLMNSYTNKIDTKKEVEKKEEEKKEVEKREAEKKEGEKGLKGMLKRFSRS